MNLLAIETATDLVGAAFLADAGRPGHPPSAVRSEPGGRRHAEALAPAIEAVCARTGHTVRDVDVVAVDNGPGPNGAWQDRWPSVATALAPWRTGVPGEDPGEDGADPVEVHR